jgi:hypothetical protein
LANSSCASANRGHSHNRPAGAGQAGRTFDVSAEEMAAGGQFTRQLLTGPFHPTSEINNCDPAADD